MHEAVEQSSQQESSFRRSEPFAMRDGICRQQSLQFSFGMMHSIVANYNSCPWGLLYCLVTICTDGGVIFLWGQRNAVFSVEECDQAISSLLIFW